MSQIVFFISHWSGLLPLLNDLDHTELIQHCLQLSQELEKLTKSF